ncbi:hypothetical protein [Aquiflexum balticum]|uniref:hypothetical protein n=1 Tax=Aquiflexum balticum TaxID=280473 RepID=UPI0012F8449B|nr:hypothetical protein [Aquiflexum balticum]
MFPVLGLQFFDVLQAFDGFFVEGAVYPLADQVVQGYAEGIDYFFCRLDGGDGIPTWVKSGIGARCRLPTKQGQTYFGDQIQPPEPAREDKFHHGGKIRLAYDAEGNKLTQKVYNSSGSLTKAQDYIGEVVLVDGALDYLVHEEGRIVSEPDGLHSEFYVKDHLGNVRQVLRSPNIQTFMATMEIQNAETEEVDFSMVSASRQTEPEHNVTEGGNEVAWLNADRGRMLGPGRTQEIYAGDSLKLQVHGKYVDDKNQKANAGSFMAVGGVKRLVADLNELALFTQNAGGANPIALFNLADILGKDLQKREAPEAYLIYALYDRDSNRYEVEDRT